MQQPNPSNTQTHASYRAITLYRFTAPSRDIKQRLQLLDQRPLILAHIVSVKLLQRIDRGPRDHRVQHVFLLELSAVEWLVGAFDLDRYRGLAFLADRDGLVLALDGGSGVMG